MPMANLCLCRTQLSSFSYLSSKVLQLLHKHNSLNASWKPFWRCKYWPRINTLINYTTAQECRGLCSLSHDNAAWLELRMKFRASCETPKSHPPGRASGCMLLPGEKSHGWILKGQQTPWSLQSHRHAFNPQPKLCSRSVWLQTNTPQSPLGTSPPVLPAVHYKNLHVTYLFC